MIKQALLPGIWLLASSNPVQSASEVCARGMLPPPPFNRAGAGQVTASLGAGAVPGEPPAPPGAAENMRTLGTSG